MNKELIDKYTPLALVIAAIFIQMNLFVTPDKLEIKHREILDDVSKTYVTRTLYDAQYTEVKDQLQQMSKKIDKIYDIISKK